MRILIDECAPRPLRNQFPGHDARTVSEMGWSGKKNGELLALMASQGFEVLVTTDSNLRYQQNISASGVAVIVMFSVTNRLAELLPLVPSVLAAIGTRWHTESGECCAASQLNSGPHWQHHRHSHCRAAILNPCFLTFCERRSAPPHGTNFITAERDDYGTKFSRVRQ
jgi:predicted nuclease of predicted toxin-antitoxin system